MIKEKEIVLIAPDRESMALYKNFLTVYRGFCYSPYFQLEEFTREMFNNHNYVGFIVDLRSILKSEPNARHSFEDLTKSFPLVRISHTPDKKTINGNIRDKNFRDRELFDFFINDMCRCFTPRGLRAKKRKNLFLNVYLDFSEDASGVELIRANTADISPIGGFLISDRKVKKDDVFYMVINELADQSPIKCKVKWALPWGTTNHHLPGFGVTFTVIKQEQQQELDKILHRPS